MLIGPPDRGEVVLVDHDPAWAIRFEDERKRIDSAIGAVAKRIEHIGSTAIPQLAAKPVVGILVTVDDVENEGAYRPPLERAGYALRVREPGHRMFRTQGRDVHVHVWQAGSDEERRHLLFRDWLRQHRDDRTWYEQTKRGLAARQWADRNQYAEAKSAVIDAILQRATTSH